MVTAIARRCATARGVGSPLRGPATIAGGEESGGAYECYIARYRCRYASRNSVDGRRAHISAWIANRKPRSTPLCGRVFRHGGTEGGWRLCVTFFFWRASLYGKVEEKR